MTQPVTSSESRRRFLQWLAGSPVPRIETRAAMQQCGVKAVRELNPRFVGRF